MKTYLFAACLLAAATVSHAAEPEKFSVSTILSAPQPTKEQHEEDLQTCKRAQNLIAAKQCYTDLLIIDQMIKIYPVWHASARTNQQHKRGVPAGGWITISELNAWLTDSTNSPQSIWYDVYWDPLIPVPQNHVMGSLPEKDQFGNPYGPFLIGESPWIPAATKETAKDSVPSGFWGPYENSPDATRQTAPATGTTTAPAAQPAEAVVSHAPTNSQVEVANRIRDDLTRIKDAMEYCFQASQQDLDQCHRSFDPWMRSLEPVLQGRIHWPASQLVETKEKIAAQKARIGKLESRVKKGNKISITDLNDFLWEKGKFQSSKLPPGDALGHAYGPFLVGRAPWVPPASLGVLSEVGKSYWGEYANLPENIKMPADAGLPIPNAKVIENASQIYFDYFVFDHAIKDYVTATKRKMQPLVDGAQIKPEEMADAYKVSPYFYKVPVTDPFNAGYGPFVIGKPLRVESTLKSQCQGVEEGFWHDFR